MTPLIRPEEEGDVEAIYTLTKTAFQDMPYSDGDEQDVINALRDDDALTISLVATIDDEIVGHIAFSRVVINGEPGNWFGLGPVSVKPALQKQGIGGTLIRKGLERIQAMGAGGCVLLGSPDYYSRFGFVPDPGLIFAGEVSPYFQRLTISGETPKGAVEYHRAFYPQQVG